MARARNIKPGFFTNEQLAELPPLTRLLFIGLWTLADREGRLENRPKRIKVAALPYDDGDITKMLYELQELGFVRCYKSGELSLIQILNWHKHQRPHVKETPSELPAPEIPVQVPEKVGRNVLELNTDCLNRIPDTSEPPLDSDLIVKALIELHPRAIKNARTEHAVVDALIRESKALGSDKFGSDYLLNRTRIYRECTDKWPPGQRNFIKGADEWFAQRKYMEDEQFWKREENGKSSEIENSGAEAARLLGLPQRSLAVLPENSRSAAAGVRREGAGTEDLSRIIEGGIRAIHLKPQKPAPSDAGSTTRSDSKPDG